ncbi:MAG: D-glycerate dehydrogenase, partial [Bacillota bacterium]
MAVKAVLVSRDPQTPEGLSELRGFAEVRVNEGPPYSREQFRAALKDVDALLCYRDAVDDEIMSGASKLKIISNFGVGYNNID